MRVKYLATEHNTMVPATVRTWIAPPVLGTRSFAVLSYRSDLKKIVCWLPFSIFVAAVRSTIIGIHSLLSSWHSIVLQWAACHRHGRWVSTKLRRVEWYDSISSSTPMHWLATTKNQRARKSPWTNNFSSFRSKIHCKSYWSEAKLLSPFCALIGTVSGEREEVQDMNKIGRKWLPSLTKPLLCLAPVFLCLFKQMVFVFV